MSENKVSKEELLHIAKLADLNLKEDETEKYLENLKAPTCPNCNICNCRSSCKYRKWRAIDELIYKSS